MSSNKVHVFTPRLTKPYTTNKHYINYKYGGYNTCIVLDESNGYVMPNCVGYAQGRMLELENRTSCNWLLPACNAEDWYEKAQKNGLEVGQEVRLGAVIVWGKGKLHNSSDGCGHVAVVEKIQADGTITISESGYKTYVFKTIDLKPPYSLKGYTLLGFIYPTINYGRGDLDSTSVNTSFTTYVVKKGDSLWGIAQKYLGRGSRYKEIVNLNNLQSTTIYIGQTLKIPKS